MFTRTAYGASEILLVSSADGEHEELIVDRSSVAPLPPSVREAVGNVYLSTENAIESAETGEDFVFQIETGTEDDMTDSHMTSIVADDPSVNGWRTSVLLGVKPDWFNAGLYYRITAIHACQADPDRTCDDNGGDDVVFDNEENGATTISFAYESENDSKSESKATLPAKLRNSGNVSVRNSGYVKSVSGESR